MKYAFHFFFVLLAFSPSASFSEEGQPQSLTLEENLEELTKGQGASPFTNFCQEQYLQERNGKLYCNWGRSFSHACNINFPNDRYVEKGSLIEGPVDSGTCSNGKKVVKIIHH